MNHVALSKVLCECFAYLLATFTERGEKAMLKMMARPMKMPGIYPQ
ncbi:MAG: hypothetical protein IKZ62_01640 [Prevotella sp.]|nr:hypothetical protein [Prevotella sp.]